MARKPDDDLPPTTFQKEAVFDKPVDITEFVDINTGQMLIQSQGLVADLSGKPMMRASGMKLNEAMSNAARWWNDKGAKAMPDRPKRKGDEYLSQYGVASGILLGYPWDSLGREEKLKVLKAWWFNVGVPKFVGGLGTSQIDGQPSKGVLH